MGLFTKSLEADPASERPTDVIPEEDQSFELIDIFPSSGSSREVSSRELRSRFPTRHNSDLSSSKSQRIKIDIPHDQIIDALNDIPSPADTSHDENYSAKSYFRRISVGRSILKRSSRSTPRKQSLTAASTGPDTYESAINSQAHSDDVHEFNSEDEAELRKPKDAFDADYFAYDDSDEFNSSIHASSNSAQSSFSLRNSSSIGLRSRSSKTMMLSSSGVGGGGSEINSSGKSKKKSFVIPPQL